MEFQEYIYGAKAIELSPFLKKRFQQDCSGGRIRMRRSKTGWARGGKRQPIRMYPASLPTAEETLFLSISQTKLILNIFVDMEQTV
ncbi:MAG: hypothetical protein VB034_11095 [Eubacteriales bacterium]|nr:hypothetical protein [Eubacteriales bacterium]